MSFRRIGDKWYLMNDQIVKEVSWSDVNTNHIYMAEYELTQRNWLVFSTNRKPKEHYNLEQKTLVTTEIKRLNTKKNNLRTIVRNHREAMVSVASAGNSSVFLPSEHHANEKCGQNREASRTGIRRCSGTLKTQQRLTPLANKTLCQNKHIKETSTDTIKPHHWEQ